MLGIVSRNLLKEFGLTPGQVYVESERVVWQAEYANKSALDIELSSFTVEQKKRFKDEIQDKMKLLIDFVFEVNVFKVGFVPFKYFLFGKY